jgi:hypothetical protein
MDLRKKISVIFASPALQNEFDCLRCGSFEDKELYSFILRAISDLKTDPSVFIKIPKRLWPKQYVCNYGVSNL